MEVLKASNAHSYIHWLPTDYICTLVQAIHLEALFLSTSPHFISFEAVITRTSSWLIELDA